MKEKIRKEEIREETQGKRKELEGGVGNELHISLDVKEREEHEALLLQS